MDKSEILYQFFQNKFEKLFADCLSNKNFDSCCESLKKCEPVQNLSETEINTLIEVVHNLFLKIQLHIPSNIYLLQNETFVNLVIQSYKLFRNISAKGAQFQNKIADNDVFFNLTEIIVNNLNDNSIDCHLNLSKMIFQCLGNLCVQNKDTQSKTWSKLNEMLLDNLTQNRNASTTDVTAMILYNMLLEENNFIAEKDFLIYPLLIKILVENTNDDNKYDFVNLFVEYFLTKYRNFVEVYGKLDDQLRLSTIHYVQDLAKEDDKNRRINTNLIKEMVTDFKKKSDCILKTVESYVDGIQPQEVIALLELISIVTSQTYYSWVFTNDGALFLNVGCLLVSVEALGKQADNIFTPLQKLEQLAPNGPMSADLEKEISFQFKSGLVRIIANLSYRNKKMQDLAREMNIILSVLECTNSDARNPLIKEWSILAIRNLCENNEENQKLIGSLSKVGDADNSILTDNRDTNGSIRIKLD